MIGGFPRTLLIASWLFCFLPAFLYSQDTLRGRILDRATLEPLGDATISSSGSGSGAISDGEGRFSIPFSPELTVSSIGYKEQQILVSKEQSFVFVFLEASPYDLQEVVVSGIPSDRDRLISSSAAINMINARDLFRDNRTQIAQALNRTPGLFMHSGTLSTNRLTIRGIGSRTPYGTNKVRAYFRDIPLTSGTGETTLEDIDLDFIERIEVIKGPSSSLYGAGLAGTVLMYPENDPYPGTQLIQKNTFGSFGLFRNTTGLDWNTQKTSVRFAYNKTKSDGYRENNQYNRDGFFLTAAYYPSEKHTVTLLALYNRVEAYIPSSLDSADYHDNPEAAAENWAAARGVEDYDRLLTGLTHTWFIHPGLSLKTAVFGGFRNNFEIRPFNILEEENRNAGIRSYLRYQVQPGGIKTTILLGGELFGENYFWRIFQNEDREEGSLLGDNEEIRTLGNLFFQSTIIPFNRLRIHLGINLNKTNYDYSDLFLMNGDQSGEYGFDWIVSPRFAASFRIGTQLFVYANASHGFSPPTLQETLTPEGLVNPDIQPETGWNFEIGNRGALLNNRLYYDVSIYSMPVENLLVARRTAEDTYVGVNAGKTSHRGIEAAIQVMLVQNEAMNLQLFSNGTFTNYEFVEFVDGENDYSGNRLTGTPRNTINAGIDFNTGVGVYGTLNYQFIDEMPLRDDNSLYSDSYQLVNVKAGFRTMFFKRLELDVYAGINNLFDEKYASMFLINAPSFGGQAPRYYYPGLPVNYFGGLSLSYKIQ
jgi:iron complex outermembrane receptor protein